MNTFTGITYTHVFNTTYTFNYTTNDTDFQQLHMYTLWIMYSTQKHFIFAAVMSIEALQTTVHFILAHHSQTWANNWTTLHLSHHHTSQRNPNYTDKSKQIVWLFLLTNYTEDDRTVKALTCPSSVQVLPKLHPSKLIWLENQTKHLVIWMREKIKKSFMLMQHALGTHNKELISTRELSGKFCRKIQIGAYSIVQLWIN